MKNLFILLALFCSLTVVGQTQRLKLRQLEQGTAGQIIIVNEDGNAAYSEFPTGTAVLDFPSIDEDGGIQELTIAVTGAVVGRPVAWSLPSQGTQAVFYSARVSAANVVTVRVQNMLAVPFNPDSATFTVTVL